MKVLNKIFNFFVALFKRQDVQVESLNIIVSNLSSPELKELCDSDLMNKAWEFVKELHIRTDLTGKEKAEIFNKKLIEYGKKVGKVVAVLACNIIREVTYTALKIAISKGLITLLLTNGTKVTSTMNTCKSDGPVEDPNQMKLDL